MRRWFSSTTYQTSAEVANVSAEQFFHLVRDVPSYPAFVKWINSTSITSRKDLNTFEAEMGVNFKVYRGVFHSRVNCSLVEEGSFKIVSVSNDSPVFHSMSSEWMIAPTDKFKCKVDYSIDFKFKNLLYQSVSSYFVGMLGNMTLDSFIRRAFALYEKENLAKEEALEKQQIPVSLNQTEASFDFLAKREDIELEILIFQTIEMLRKDEILSQIQYHLFVDLYFSDVNFQFEMKTLFKTFPTREHILANKERILFLIKRRLASQSHSQEA